MTLSDLISMMRERGTSAPDAVLRALTEIDRRLTALEGAVSWCGACGERRAGHTQGHEYQPVLTEEEGRVVWNKLYGSEGERDPVTGAVKVASPDLLRLADEAIDACEDAKERLTFSSWEAAGQKVRAYREARREGAVKAPGQCCAAMRDQAVEAIEREIASVQKLRRLFSDERDIAVEFLAYAANHVRALEVK